MDEPLCAHLDGLVDELHRQVPLALHQFDVGAIHKSRVATRRLKAALDLLKPVLAQTERRPFMRVTRRLRRRLGPLRDLDVMLMHLDEIRGRKHADTVAWVRQHLNEQRDSIRSETGHPNRAARVLVKLGAWWELRDQVVKSLASVPGLLTESLHLQLDCFVERADRIARKSVEPESAPAHQDPHELRIAGKRLRYTLELAAASGHPLNPILFKLFKKMQDALGLWHDYVVLSESAMELSLEQHVHLHDPELQAKLLDLVRFAINKSQRELEKFAELWTQSGDMISIAIRAEFPLTRDEVADESQAITESQTDPGPSGSDEPEPPAEPDQGAAPAA